jgi:hypothetical protein
MGASMQAILTECSMLVPCLLASPDSPNIAASENEPLVEWMKRQASAGSFLHSWCTGVTALPMRDFSTGSPRPDVPTARFAIGRLEFRFGYRPARWVAPLQGARCRLLRSLPTQVCINDRTP